MSESYFQFRQFTIRQDKCAMKVGTDAVLLGSWVNPHGVDNILDIGTGTGIIAMMLAQKSTAQIDAVDICPDAFSQATENVSESLWAERISVHHISFQQFAAITTKKYDLVVSNPPYFSDAPKPLTWGRIQSRHTDMLTFTELIKGVGKVLARNGKFCVVLPCREGAAFMDEALEHGLFCSNIMHVKTKPDKEEKRLLMEFSLHLVSIGESEMVIRKSDNEFSEEYLEMTKEYYPW
jgi:tRNA1Val (adenine37-N6)-methyltransferase